MEDGSDWDYTILCGSIEFLADCFFFGLIITAEG